MKQVLLLILITAGVAVIWGMSITTLHPTQFMPNQKALDLSKPFSDTIDIEFLKGLQESSQSTSSM